LLSELIGVTEEDRNRGYDTAVSIATASGEVLIAVGTGGIASALSKGGTIARTASGALVAFDAAGNAVGVVQGFYDGTHNGWNISNGAKVAGGLLGLGANAVTARGVKAACCSEGKSPLYNFQQRPQCIAAGPKGSRTKRGSVAIPSWITTGVGNE